MSGQRGDASVVSALRLMGDKVEALGRWAQGWRYWSFFGVMCVIVVLKSGFKWAGTTGNGWYGEYQDVINAWPLKESLADVSRAHWEEFYAGIVAFRAFVAVGFPQSNATWVLVHLLASLAAIALIGLWALRTYGSITGRAVAALILFGAAPLILLQEVGRYDAFFLLGAVMLVTSRKWPAIILGSVVMGASTWVMGGLLGLTLLVTACVLGSRNLVWRGIAGIIGAIGAAGALMLIRLLQGGDPSLRKGAIGDQGQDHQSFADVVARIWWNVVQPFPNWIYAALGLTWLLFAVVIFQSSRRRIALAFAILGLPFLAFAVNTSDGTRDLALPLVPLVIAAASVLAARSSPDPKDDPAFAIGPRVFGALIVLCLVVPVIDINPHTPLNPYGWLGLRGLSIVWTALGQG